MNVYLGIDIGTTNIKALLVDEAGKVLKSMSHTLSLSAPYPAWAEQNPEDWWDGVMALMRQVPEDMNVLCIGLSGQMHTLVPVDSAGKVLHNAILWCDQRTVAECGEATEKLGGESAVIAMTGNPIYPGFTMPKILWLRKNAPEIYSKIDTCFIAKDYIGYRLTGVKCAEPSDASGSACYDVKLRQWRLDLLDKLGIPEAWLPEVRASHEARGTLRPELADELGWSKEVKVICGGADNAVAALGLGVLEPGDCMVSIGTSGTVLAATEATEPDLTGKLHFFNHVLPGQSYYMGCMLSAAASLDWFKNKMAKDMPWDVLNRGIDETAVGAGGMLFLPYLNGERTPHRNANARGVLYGFSTMSDERHIFRAVMEGITYGLRDSFELILGKTPVKRVLVVGGGAKSRTWCKMLASNINMPVSLPMVDEGGAYGAAMLCAISCGAETDDVKGWIKVREQVEPDSDEAEKYSKVYSQFRALYGDLAGRFDETAGL